MKLHSYLKTKFKNLYHIIFTPIQNTLEEREFSNICERYLLTPIKYGAIFLFFNTIMITIKLFNSTVCKNEFTVYVILNLIALLGFVIFIWIKKKFYLLKIIWHLIFLYYFVKNIIAINTGCNDSQIEIMSANQAFLMVMLFSAFLELNWFILTIEYSAINATLYLQYFKDIVILDFLFINICFGIFSFYIGKFSRELFHTNFKLKENLKQFKNIMDNYITDPILLINPSLDFIYQNQAAVELHNNSISGKSFSDYFKDMGKNYMLNTSLLENQEEIELEMKKNNEVLFYTYKVKDYIWEEIEHTLMFFFRNITQQKLYNQQLEENSEFKDLMISTVSHDIRTPLNCSITMTKISLENTDNPVIRKHLEFSLKSSVLLLAIVNDLLDYGQLNSKKFKLNNNSFLLKEIIDDVNGYYEVLIQEKNLLFTINYDFSSSLMVYSDKERIERVILNIIGNALKFTSNGEIIWILKYNYENEELFISVKDSGIGIKEEDRNKLFRLYGKLESRESANSHGIGLGLTISNMIVSSLKGIEDERVVINLETEYGNGSSFSFSIPLKKHNFHMEVPTMQVLDTERRRQSIRNLTSSHKFCDKVLVIEDEETNLYVMKILLERKGKSFILTRNGKEAQELVISEFQNSKLFPLIITDINMPIMNGYEFTQWYRSFETENLLNQTSIVACTANVSNKDMEIFEKYNFTSFLEKPIDLIKIDSIIDKYYMKSELEVI